MTTFSTPYADPGRAAFQELDTHVQSWLLAGPHPELAPAIAFPLPNSVSYAQFTVVGLDASGNLVPATFGRAAAAATGTLTFSGTGSNGDTVVIGGRTYTLKTALAAADDVLIGASATATAANLAAAINGAAGAGTTYGTGTAPNALVTAAAATGVVTLTARDVGDDGNEITTTETSSGAAFGATTLTGGRDVGGVQPIGVLCQAASLGASGTGTGLVWYSGCFSQDALVWDASFDTDAKKQAAFRGSPTPTNIIVAKR